MLILRSAGIIEMYNTESRRLPIVLSIRDTAAKNLHLPFFFFKHSHNVLTHLFVFMSFPVYVSQLLPEIPG